MQLTSARSMGIIVLGSVEIRTREKEVRSETGDISQAEQTQEGILLNNTATIIVHHGRKNNLTEIVNDVHLDPYKEWDEF